MLLPGSQDDPKSMPFDLQPASHLGIAQQPFLGQTTYCFLQGNHRRALGRAGVLGYLSATWRHSCTSLAVTGDACASGFGTLKYSPSSAAIWSPYQSWAARGASGVAPSQAAQHSASG